MLLRPTVQALPKTSEGCLPANAARYALHRLFVQRGWFVKGLQELDPAPKASGKASGQVEWLGALLEERPRWVRQRFEQLLRGQGLCLEELSALASLLEDSVHRETMQRVLQAFKAKKMPLVGRIQKEKLAEMLEYVMMSYILEVVDLEGTKLEQQEVSQYLEGKKPMEEHALGLLLACFSSFSQGFQLFSIRFSWINGFLARRCIPTGPAPSSSCATSRPWWRPTAA